NIKYPSLNQLKLSTTVSSRIVLTFVGSVMKGVDPYLPVKGVQNGDMPRRDAVLLTADTAAIVYYLNPMYRRVVHGSVDFVTNKHSLSAGYTFNRAYFGTTDVFSTGPYFPAGLRAVYRNGVPDSVETTNSPVSYEQYL